MFKYGEGHDWELIEHAGTIPVYRCKRCGRRSNGVLVFKCGDIPAWFKEDEDKPRKKSAYNRGNLKGREKDDE